MKNKLVTLGVLLAFFICFMGNMAVFAEETAAAIYVAESGDDANEGTLEKPFRTLERARDAIRKIKQEGALPKGGITVYLRGGEYPLKDTFSLTEEDSGTKDAYITYSAYKNETVKILGGRYLPQEAFEPLSDAEMTKKIQPFVQDKIYQLDLNKVGVEKVDGIEQFGHRLPALKYSAVELFFNNQIMQLSRYPNEGYLSMGKILDKGTEWRNYDSDVLPGSSNYVPPEQRDNPWRGGEFVTNDKRPLGWSENSDLWIFGFPYHDWADLLMKVDTIDKKKSSVKTVHASPYGFIEGGRYYFMNVPEEVDSPGEFYIDRTANTLYIYPPGSMKDAKILISLSKNNLFNVKDASCIRFSKLVFEATRAAAVTMENVDDIQVSYCTIDKTGKNAIDIKQGTNISIYGCHVFDNGAGGIYVQGGDRMTLTPSGNTIVNNTIHNYARIEKTYMAAVNISGVGNRVANNEIYDGAHLAISYGGNDNIIEYNEIYNVLQGANDMGAIYSGRDWSMRGNVIRYNYFHNIETSGGSHGVHGVYLDDGLSDVTIFGNVFYKVDDALFIHGGRSNTFKNNIIVDSSRAMGASAIHPSLYDRAMVTLVEGLKNSPYQTEIWLKKYPVFKDLLESDPGVPAHNNISDNIIVNTGAAYIDAIISQKGTVKNNLTFSGDPGFTDYKNEIFSFKEDAAVFDKIPDFENIPFDKIGIFGKNLDKKIKKMTLLMVNSPVAYVKGEERQMDENSSLVVPIVKDGVTFVPVRFVAESLGAKVDFSNGEIKVRYGGKYIKMALNSNRADISGTVSELQAPCFLLQDRTMVPLRVLMEGLGKKVFWDARGLIVISDRAAILDEKQDAQLINEFISQLFQ